MFKDHFSHVSDKYRQYRPGYPEELFAWLASLTGSRNRAWDCATGNGQAAVGLSRHFKFVTATDASPEQIRHADTRKNISYSVCPAEEASIENNSVNLVTVAQAAHWLNLPRFYAEVCRVLKPAGVLALWCYGLCRIGPEIDERLDEIYSKTLGPFWPPERRWVDERYTTLPFPFREIEAPPFCMTEYWTLEHFIRYMGTWSAVKEFRKAEGNDPMPQIGEAFSAVWPEPHHPREIRWPIHMRVGVRANHAAPLISRVFP